MKRFVFATWIRTDQDGSLNRLEAIDAELRLLGTRREELLRERERLLLERRRDEATEITFSPDEKIALFLSLFRYREDVYPRLWENPKTGMKGYSPVCRNEWFRGVCEKPRVKCSECMHQAFPPLDEVAAKDHLTGKSVIGTYAIRADNTCVFLAADFDGKGWNDDVIAYQKAARELGVDVAIERSRSGNGDHAWIYFSEPVPALMARSSWQRRHHFTRRCRSLRTIGFFRIRMFCQRVDSEI